MRAESFQPALFGDTDPLRVLRRQIGGAGLRVGHDGAGTWYVKRGGVVLATRPSFRSIEQAVRALLAARDGAN